MRCHGRLDPQGDVQSADADEDATQPHVSVIMGAFNCADTLSPAIESILGQTYTNLELVICDDGSSDATLEVARAWAARDRRVVVIQNESNLGLAPTLNRCLDIARGELVARMDGDDLCDPTRIRRQVDALASSPGMSVVGSATYYFDERGIWGSGEVAALPTTRGLVRGTPFVHGSVTFRRHAVAEVGNYSESPARRRVEDFDLWVRLYAAGHRGINISEPLYGLRNDRDAAGRRSIGARLNEARVIAAAVSCVDLSRWHYLRTLRPLALGLLPVAWYQALYRRRHRAAPPSRPRVVGEGKQITWADLQRFRADTRNSTA
jgi:glycosyltransferase EpsE